MTSNKPEDVKALVQQTKAAHDLRPHEPIESIRFEGAPLINADSFFIRILDERDACSRAGKTELAPNWCAPSDVDESCVDNDERDKDDDNMKRGFVARVAHAVHLRLLRKKTTKAAAEQEEEAPTEALESKNVEPKGVDSRGSQVISKTEGEEGEKAGSKKEEYVEVKEEKALAQTVESDKVEPEDVDRKASQTPNKTEFDEGEKAVPETGEDVEVLEVESVIKPEDLKAGC